jgi:hypothetical protein
MNEAMQTIQLPLWLYHDLQMLAHKKHANSVEEVIAQLVEQAQESSTLTETSTPIFQRILARATDMGVSDLSEHHDFYLYGEVKDGPSQS